MNWGKNNWRKNPDISLKKQTFMFSALGLVVALSVVLVSFEWRTYSETIRTIVSDIVDEELEEEAILVTLSAPPPPPPPPPQVVDIIEIVENDVAIEDELEIVNADSDENDDNTFDSFGNDGTGEEEGSDEAIDANLLTDYPIFPGCEDVPAADRMTCLGKNMIQAITKVLKYPSDAREMQKQGKVILQFVIEKDGQLSNILVKKSVYESLDEAGINAIKQVSEMYKGKIKPGKQAGKPVRVYLSVPITFNLN